MYFRHFARYDDFVSISLPGGCFFMSYNKDWPGILNLAQAALASVFNISPSTVKRWEQGVKRPAEASKKLLDIMERKGSALLAGGNAVVPEQFWLPIKTTAGFLCLVFKKAHEAILTAKKKKR